MNIEKKERIFYQITTLICLILIVLFGIFYSAKQKIVKFSVQQTMNIQKQKINKLQQQLKKYTTPSEVTVYAYNPHINQCDSTPFITASMEKVKPGMVAVSHDLWEQGWTFGKKIYIKNIGVFRIADFMNTRHKTSIDIFMWQKKDAIKFGIQQTKACLIVE